MPRLAFQVVDSNVEIAADDDLLHRLRALYEKFPPPTTRPRSDFRFEWNGNECRTRLGQGTERLTRVDNPVHRSTVSGSLLAQALTATYPDYSILHGNALRSRVGTGVVLFIGASGTGKTTLTRQLAHESPDWEPVAEDVLIMDPDNQLLHPYPRALSIRRDAPEFHPPEKHLHPHPATVQDPVYLAKARVFILCAELPSSTPSSSFHEQVEHVWLTHDSTQIREALRRAGLPLVGVHHEDGMTRLDYMRLLDSSEKRTQAEILERHGAMILATGNHARDSLAPPARRPARPRVIPLPSGDGVRHCMPHVIRPTLEAALTPGGRHFIRLAKALQTAAFSLLIPGGSPRDTAWAIAEATMP
jgi:energy-coupling factor transporter ATP-binding protein EcfA2